MRKFFLKFSILSALKTALSVFGLAICVQYAAAGEAQGEAQQVGEVSLVLGKASRLTAEGASAAIARGNPVYVGDQITTSSNGHVHIRFVDDALVSVRPGSQLLIERYDFDPQSPELSAVKFRLEEGITRSISGEAARNARERFRLNTPIAAIGVRGTDFVVSTDNSSTRAQVYEGTIVLAPYSDVCSVDALGPCLANSLELSGDNLQVAALDGSTPLPRLLPPQSVRNSSRMREEAQAAIAGAESQALVSSQPEQTRENEVRLDSLSTTTVTADAEIAATEAVSAAVTSPDTLAARQLVWGRYASNSQIQDVIALNLETASADREITVGNFSYGLFRQEEDSKRVSEDLTVVGFELNSAQAFYNSETGIVAMSVDGGSLDIDFLENRFATALSLSHELTGAIDFQAAGRLFDGGYFHARDDSQRIAGAVSIDGSEAGYFFERQLEAGNISGLTLWDSR